MNEQLLLEIMQEANADILCFGHSHKPYHRIVQDDKIRHAVNIGSVGKPKDGDPRNCYVLLHLDSNRSDAGSLKVEFVRTVYDIEKAAQAVENSPLPDDLADMLRNAY